MKRLVWMDNLRTATVIIVMIYHVFYMFNAEGVPGGVGSFAPVQYQDIVLYLVYPWFMALLFVLSGISARLALQKKTLKEFLKERTKKLLVPATLGLFVFQWIVGFYNLKIGDAFSYLPGFLIYPISVLSGIGPLWFIQMLWLFDLLLVLAVKLTKKKQFQVSTNIFILLLLGIGLWLCSYIGNLPVLTMYRFGIYLFAFVAGYVFFQKEALETLQKNCLWLGGAACVLAVLFVWINFGADYTSSAVLTSFLCNAYAWVAILALIGLFEKWSTVPWNWLNSCSWGWYILHYACVLIPCFYLKQTGWPVWLIYLVALVVEFVLCGLLYDGLKRIPGIRFAVLGMSKKHDQRPSH